MKLLCNRYGVAKYFAYRLVIIPSEVGDGIVVWRQLFHQPHQFNITVAFLFQCPRRADAVQISVHKKINNAYFVIRSDYLVQELWKKNRLFPVIALYLMHS